MAPKGQKMNLNDFLNDQSFGDAPPADIMNGSWADEDAPMPTSANLGSTTITAASSRDTTPMDWTAAKRGGGMGMGDSRPPMREPREPVPVPDEPPFTARFLNLDYSVVEEDIEKLLDPSWEVVGSIRLPKENGRARGFAFVEFKNKSDLENALKLTGQDFKGRELRVFVSDKAVPQQDERFAGDWRAAGSGPLPPPRREDPRDYNNWERKGPLSGGAPRRSEHQQQRPQGRLDPSFLEMSWERKGPLPSSSQSERKPRNFSSSRPQHESHEHQREKPSAMDAWDQAAQASKVSPRSANTTTTTPGPGRTKLNLKPRTVGAHSATPEASEQRSSSVFGAAKPVDTTAKLLEAEERAKEQDRAMIEHQKEQKNKILEAQQAKKQRELEREEQVRKRFNLLTTEDDDNEGEGEGEQATKEEAKPVEEEKKKTDEKTEAERILASEASKEDLEGDGWEVVDSKRRK